MLGENSCDITACLELRDAEVPTESDILLAVSSEDGTAIGEGGERGREGGRERK